MNFNWIDMLNKLINLFIKSVFGAIFLLVVTPLGILLRIFGVDLLKKRIDPQAESYWKKHN